MRYHPGSGSCVLMNHLDLRVVIFHRVLRSRRSVLIATGGGSGGVLRNDAGGAVVGVEDARQPLGNQVGAAHVKLAPRKRRYYRDKAE